MITGAQLRQDRALLRSDQGRLAKNERLKVPVVIKAESVHGEPPVGVATRYALQSALESPGVIFTTGDEPGVRLLERGNDD